MVVQIKSTWDLLQAGLLWDTWASVYPQFSGLYAFISGSDVDDAGFGVEGTTGPGPPKRPKIMAQHIPK